MFVLFFRINRFFIAVGTLAVSILLLSAIVCMFSDEEIANIFGVLSHGGYTVEQNIHHIHITLYQYAITMVHVQKHGLVMLSYGNAL